MKRKICAGLVTIGLLFGLTACNRQIVDLTYAYDYAIKHNYRFFSFGDAMFIK